MKYNIVGGVSQHNYHIVSSDLDLITTNPEREHIFEYLSLIHPSKFDEFIEDVLVKVEGHTPVDVTDGPGDEKQDILTISPDGKRCLTQCKHTINHKKNYTGNELDLMFSACLRKSCQIGFFVTDSDLSHQEKVDTHEDFQTIDIPQ